MNNEKLLAFLLEANKNTYATGDESLQKKEADKSTTIMYKNGDWNFHDNFFGGEPYGGREVVFYQNAPVWIMTYYGSVDKKATPGDVYPVLQQALRHMPHEAPFRGPALWEDGDYTYTNTWTGTVERFSGEEAISRKGKEIYRATYMGGFVDKK